VFDSWDSIAQAHNSLGVWLRRLNVALLLGIVPARDKGHADFAGLKISITERWLVYEKSSICVHQANARRVRH